MACPACRAVYVLRRDGATCLDQLTEDALPMTTCYQWCFDAGLPVLVQVNLG